MGGRFYKSHLYIPFKNSKVQITEHCCVFLEVFGNFFFFLMKQIMVSGQIMGMYNPSGNHFKVFDFDLIGEGEKCFSSFTY